MASKPKCVVARMTKNTTTFYPVTTPEALSEMIATRQRGYSSEYLAPIREVVKAGELVLVTNFTGAKGYASLAAVEAGKFQTYVAPTRVKRKKIKKGERQLAMAVAA